MSTVALIPARGGSKRIPRKNVRLFAGQPMIAHSLRAAGAAGVFDRILVSTDDPEIAAVAREHGAEVPFVRPAELANDFAGTDAVIGHALEWLAVQGQPAARFCCIYATAPFLRPADLRRGLAVLEETQAATAFSVTTYPYTIFRSLKFNATGRVEMFWPENFTKRSQDLPAAWHDAAQFYWGDTAKYLAERRLFSSNSVPVEIPRARVQDIDTPEDWEVAELMFQALEAREARATATLPV
ncbi:MAG: pseudaminic acid cytidylyltransferase [Opitutae bacterium]|nr:pseudaminic acid cytidylyltransferase [Opitutae bacterium]